MGVVLACLGSIVVILNAPKESSVDTLDEIGHNLVNPGKSAAVKLVMVPSMATHPVPLTPPALSLPLPSHSPCPLTPPIYLTPPALSLPPIPSLPGFLCCGSRTGSIPHLLRGPATRDTEHPRLHWHLLPPGCVHRHICQGPQHLPQADLHWGQPAVAPLDVVLLDHPRCQHRHADELPQQGTGHLQHGYRHSHLLCHVQYTCQHSFGHLVQGV